MDVSFTVPAIPVTQPAKEHRMVKARDGREFISASTPKYHPVNSYKATVAMAARAAYTGPPLDGPLVVSMVFVFPRGGRPSWLTRREYPGWFAKWNAGERVPCCAKKRYDRDNLMKSTQDALFGIIADDGLIFAGDVEKWIATEGEQPHVEIRIVSETEVSDVRSDCD